MQFSERYGKILHIADACGGAVTMPVLYAAMPEMNAGNVRRLVSKLVRIRALVPVLLRGAGYTSHAYLTVQPEVEGHGSGLVRFIKDEAVRATARSTGKVAGCIFPTARFVHGQIAAEVACGYGVEAFELEPELWATRGDEVEVGDGHAWPEGDRCLAIEVERMVGQSPHRWMRKKGRPGLAHRILPTLFKRRRDWRTEYLVVAPTSLAKTVPDAAATLLEGVRKLAGRELAPPLENAGFWYLAIDNLLSRPRWCPLIENRQPWRSLDGIATRQKRAVDVTHHADASW